MAALAGIVINTYNIGISGLKMSFAGLILPVLFLGIFFYTRHIGAGDIKLFSAIGALLGWRAIIYIIIYSFLTAGIICIVRSIGRRELKEVFLSMASDIKLYFISPKLISANDICSRHIFKLSPAIAAGVLINALTGFLGT